MDTSEEIDDTDDIEAIEIELLLSGIYKRYGYDFRDYAAASIRRRILNFARTEDLSTISAVLEKVLHDAKAMDRFVHSLTVNVTSMFRDPQFFDAIRKKVVPFLKTYPLVRIWNAGCSSGEEAYSMAILLQEEGIYDKCRIYATDMNESVLRQAKSGIFHISHMKDYTDNYIQSGGTRSFSEYYTAKFDHVILAQSLRKNIIFAQHNLVSDRSFNEFNLIILRNVLIYFNGDLRQRVLTLVHESLMPLGFLTLGKRESLGFTNHESDYHELDSAEKIYRRTSE